MTIADSDEDLVRRSRDGDVQARRDLIARHVDMVFRIAYRMARTRAEAEDIAQDTLERMLEYEPGWLSPVSFRVWVRRALLNRLIDAARRGKRWSFLRPLTDGVDARDGQPDAEETMSMSQTARAVSDAVRALPQRQQAAIVLCHYEGASLAEAAKTMATTEGAVEQLLQRARAKLRLDLRDLMEGERP